jgi:8-oxo-dGTP pyrophosphatase MutT (NUDIX family)
VVVVGAVERYGLYLAIALAVVLLVRLRRRAPEPLPQVVGEQVAAVPVRVDAQGALEVLLVTTRGSGRWTVPKGWPMRGLSDHDAAAREAYEEAGVRGRVDPRPIGSFEYSKRTDASGRLRVTLYRLDVEREVRRFRERGQRKSRWLAPGSAAELVPWPGLAEALRALEP